MARMLTGYFFVILLIPAFILLLSHFSTETERVQSFHDVLDEKIHIEKTMLSQTSYIKADNGQIISEIHKPIHRIYVSSQDIPDFIKQIFIVSEDQNFYEHPGFDLTAIGRALAVNMGSNEIKEGASTLTQQLARNLYLNHEITYNRKLSEILYAYQLERTYSKEEILELYINTVYFQNGAYGIEAAASTYFQKKATELTKAEQAFIAAIPNNPTLYNPLKNFDNAKARQERLIDLMQGAGAIHFEEAAALKLENIQLSIVPRIDQYPDYVTYVETELKDLISYEEGFQEKIVAADGATKERIEEELQARYEEVMESGIIIETALNPTIQQKAVQAVKLHLPYKDIEGAATVIDHQTNEIIALVGGKNYQKYDFNRAFQGYRQPGSSIKPLLAYGPYIDKTNADLTERISANAYCKNGYCPKNYGGGTYGMVSLEQAFIHSYNTPAVQLLDKIGVGNAFLDLEKFDFQRVTKEDYGLPAAIGGFSYGMTTLELSNAFTVFATKGNYKPARAIRQVTDLSGKILYQWQDEPINIWKYTTISKMRTLLNKAVTAGTGKKAYVNRAYIGGKTGTTNDYHDFWFVGLTERITAGVWIGKDTPASIKAVERTAPHLLIWKEIISSIEE